MGRTDLHMHSSVSLDGTVSPRGLAELCRQEGITLAALTDHNDVAGTAEFVWRSAQLGIRAVPGIEMDGMYGAYNVHILGYGIDIANSQLLQVLQETRGKVREAGLALMDAVEALGIRFDREQVLETAGEGAVCAEIIARSALQMPENDLHPLIRPLLPGGALAKRPEAAFYWSVCAPGKPAYVPVAYMSAEQVLAVIHAAGGIAVLAHPGVNLAEEAALFGVLGLQLDGVEAFSSYHTAAQADFYKDKAEERHLLITGGSDFHGRSKPDIRLGAVDWRGSEQNVRDGLLAALQQLSNG